jgi:hypothetical protein
MKHPHNANPNIYDNAVKKIIAISQEARSLDDIAFCMVFDTIEASAARSDAVEVNKAVWALRDAIEATRLAIHKANVNATERAETLARNESAK